MDAPGGLFQLCILAGLQLWGSWGQEVGVGVWLDGGQRRTVAIGVALLHREEGAAGFSASHFDPPLIACVSAVGWRRSQRLLGGVAVVNQLVWRGWLPVVGLRLLSLQLLLFPPNIIQKNFAVAPSPSTSSSSARPAPVRKPIVELCPSLCHLFGAGESPSGDCSSVPRLTFLWGADAPQEPVGAVAVTSYDSFKLAGRSWVRGYGGGRGVLGARRERGRMKGVGRGKGGWMLVRSVGLKSL